MITRLEKILKDKNQDPKKEVLIEVTAESICNIYIPKITGLIKEHNLKGKKIHLYSGASSSYYGNDPYSYSILLEDVKVRTYKTSFYNCSCGGLADGSEHLHFIRNGEILQSVIVKNTSTKKHKSNDDDLYLLEEIIKYIFSNSDDSFAKKYDLDELKEYIEANFVSKNSLKNML